MTETADASTLPLVIVNLALALFCAAAVLAVAVAAVRDVLERRRMRAPMPDAWPPTSDDVVQHGAAVGR